MTVPQCVNAPDDGRAHGAREWHVVVIAVIVTVIVLAHAGLSPDWIAASAALVGAATRR
ncbi:hypothetical protein [Streptomyces formicae]|uniref:Uncharacterized protein n=1 Tax=Streptomyces formicae TaxID=1616117 RepID=A0A291Q2Y6_9ACTN|nr:hypothetical protein [Streptomyces formicae]ATL26079.1 hypothetical protein KY5_1061c [Streptomyces formicae]